MSSSEYPRTHELPASQRIPPIARPFVSERALKTLDLVERFVEEECLPADAVLEQQIGYDCSSSDRFSKHPAILDELKQKARKAGLWNLFLPAGHFQDQIGAGFSNLEYGLMAESLGKSRIASEACNCSAPDTGNMEVLAKYGNAPQRKQWLEPLLEGQIRSAFLMTEPQVASSDATNIELNIRQEGRFLVLNGQKWWSSGAGDPRCELFIVMGKSDPNNKDRYKQQSVVLVPADTDGIKIHRMLSVFGYDDAPHGHGHITFDNVRVPVENMVLGPGRGFEIIQGRLGPGRIHHAMRCIGAAERALDLFIARLYDPSKKPFNKPLHQHGIMLSRVARTRIEIDAARLVVLNAAIAIDTHHSAKSATREIAAAKILVPQTLLATLDRAIQAYGGAGVSQETPLAAMWAQARTMRIVDGPDEVHLIQLAKRENQRAARIREYLKVQKEASEKALKRAGLTVKDPLEWKGSRKQDKRAKL